MRRIRIRAIAARTGSTRRNGLIFAVVCALLFASIITWTLAKNGPSQSDKPKLAIEDVTPPDIKSTPLPAANGLPSAPDGSGFFWEMADRDDPSRRAGLVRAATGTPGVGGSYILTKPELLYYLKDGRLVHFVAEKGEALFPTADRGTRPESGFFEGNVVFKLFEVPTDARTIDVARDTPSLTGTTSRLEYDGAFGEVRAPAHMIVVSDQGKFEGSNVSLVISEARQQLMSAAADPGAIITINPAKAKAARAPKPAPQAVAVTSPASRLTTDTATVPPQPSPAPPPPKHAFYQLNSAGGVTVNNDPREITAHEVRAWLHLIDNTLPPNALGSLAAFPTQSKSEATPAPAATNPPTNPTPSKPESTTAPSSTPPTSTPKPPAEQSPLRLAFAGPLDIKLLDQRPAELDRDDVRVKFLAGNATRATFNDKTAKATATGNEIEYAATTSRLAVVGDNDNFAELKLAEGGTLSAERLDADLAKGTASIKGLGTLTDRPDGSTTPRTLSWSDGATIAFATRDGRPTGAIEWFKPRGNVVAVDKSGTFSGNELDATFAPIPGNDAKRFLKQMVLRDGVLSDQKRGRLEGSRITADFAHLGTGTNSWPTNVAVRGDALATSGDSSLEAHAIDAVLTRDKDGKVGIDHATAWGDARFDGRDGLWAKAERIEADIPREIADLTGPDVRLGQNETFVQGTQMRLEGADRQRLTVFGHGNFSHKDDAGATAAASWSKQMTFIDAAGTLECAGDVAADWRADQWSRDEAKADRVTMWFTPQTAGRTLSLPGREEPKPDKTDKIEINTQVAKVERKLLRAQAIGSIAEDDKGERASIESRRFANADGSLERLMYVEGATITADEEKGTLHVPGAGVLFALDHRAAAERQKKAAKNGNLANQLAGDATGSRGEAKFEWKGSLLADRNARTATLHDSVKLRHHRSQDGLLTDLECTDLVATMAGTAANAAENANAKDMTGDLKTALAKGAVWLRSGTREITGGELLYDAANGLVDAQGQSGGLVNIFDQGRATPMTAKRIMWNLISGRLEVREPGTIVAPN